MDGDVPGDTISIVWRSLLSSVTLENRDLGTYMRATVVYIKLFREMRPKQTNFRV
jgi:hypothetical protein